MAGYSGTPLVTKIGIKPGHRLLLVNAPKDFGSTLGQLPDGAKSVTKGKSFDVAVVFVTSAADLERRLDEIRPHMDQSGMIWAAWPKKASGVATDLSEDRVRNIGLVSLVDVKVCAMDDTWSGLKFVIRVADRKKPAATITNAKASAKTSRQKPGPRETRPKSTTRAKSAKAAT